MIAYSAEALDGSELHSSKGILHQERNSPASVDLTSALRSSQSDSGVVSAKEDSYLRSTDIAGSLCESRHSHSPPLGALSPRIDPLEPYDEQQLCLPATDGRPGESQIDEDESPIQETEDQSREETHAHHCEHGDAEDHPQEPKLD